MTRKIRNQIVGVCRFSYLGDGGFAASGQSIEDLAAELYNPERMERRFAFFEKVCLPSMAAQTDQDFVLVVLIGDTMPFRWRKRLKGLAADHAFLQICTLEAAGPLNSTRRAFRRGVIGDDGFVTGFRIDDDDAVAVDYIARTREISDKLLTDGWADAETPAVVAFHRGIYWDMNDHEAPFYDFCETTPLGLASAMITPVETQSNIFRWNHRKLAAQVRCWTDPTDIMFLRTLHQHNDSDRSIPPGAEPLPLPQVRQLMIDRFGLESTDVIPLMWRRRKGATE